MSDLQFQEKIVGLDSLRFRSFYGRIVDQMPLLLSGKDEAGKVVDVPRVPLTPRQLLYERVRGENVYDQNLLRDNYVDTACAVITDSGGEVLVGLYSDPLVKELIHGLHPESRLQHGSLLVDADTYQEIKKNKAFVIPADAASNLRNSWHSEQRVREGFWDYIAEGDAQLVRNHLRLVQERQGGSMEDHMGLWLSANPGLRLLCAWSVGVGGGADGGRLGSNSGRLAGVVAPEAHSAEGARKRAAQKSGPYREPSYPQRPSLEETLTAVLPAAQRYAPTIVYGDLEKDLSATLSELYRRR